LGLELQTGRGRAAVGVESGQVRAGAIQPNAKAARLFKPCDRALEQQLLARGPKAFRSLEAGGVLAHVQLASQCHLGVFGWGSFGLGLVCFSSPC